MKKLFFSGLAALLHLGVKAQTLTQFNQERQRLDHLVTVSLGTWTGGNLLVSGGMIGRTTGVAQEFHRMNVYWNLVNLAFVGAGVYQWLRARPADAYTAAETFKLQRRMEKVLLFNTGLDVGYVATGLYLRERAGNVEKHQARWRGYGNALVLQGGFLLLFDATMYLLINRHGQQLDPWLQRLAPADGGAGLQWKF